MRFLFIQQNADLYGSSRSLLRLGRRLIRDGHAVCVALPYDGPLRKELESLCAEVRLQPGLAIVDGRLFKSPLQLLKFLLGFPSSVFRMARLIRHWKADIVHSNSSVIISPAIAARLLRVPHVWHIRENYSGRLGFWRWHQHFMAAFSSAIVCVSKSIEAQFEPQYRRSKTHVIHNGFPKEEFAPVEAARVRAFKARYGLAENEILVGLVGRINLKRKGQNILVDAVAQMGPDAPRARYLIIGSVFPGNEDQLDRLQDLIRERNVEDRFVLTGDVDDIKAAYAALDIVLMISELPEAFSGVVMEGMAMGRPVIGTNCGGTAEQMVPNETGLLIPPGDATALAQAIRLLLDNPAYAAQLARSGHERFMSCFEFDAYYKKILSLYQSL